MLSKNLKVIRYAGIFIFVAVLCSVLVFPSLRGGAASPAVADLQKEMETVKAEIESKGATPARIKHYTHLDNLLSKCGVVSQTIEPTIKAPFAPAASLCLNGSLAATDQVFNRPANQTTGSGVAAGCPAGSNPSVYDVYNFNLTGCTVFPTEVTITTCGPAGCAPVAATDTVTHLYRNVPAGDPLTANGGLPGVFNPASPCTNIRAANASLNGGAASTPGTGNTCNQTNTANCLGTCAANTLTSGFRRQLGSGRFTVVISATNTTDTGGYNLYIDAPASGCAVALSPLAATASIGGRVSNPSGSGLSKVAVTLSGNGIQRQQVYTNGFGYYTFSEVPVGDNYVLTVGSKQYTFNPATRVINLEDNISDADFVSEQ
jgi:hypothetical protein